jgi:hypothetical protein
MLLLHCGASSAVEDFFVFVPEHIRAAWCGHTVTVNKLTYRHARPKDMATALAALSKINNAV